MTLAGGRCDPKAISPKGRKHGRTAILGDAAQESQCCPTCRVPSTIAGRSERVRALQVGQPHRTGEVGSLRTGRTGKPTPTVSIMSHVEGYVFGKSKFVHKAKSGSGRCVWGSVGCSARRPYGSRKVQGAKISPKGKSNAGLISQVAGPGQRSQKSLHKAQAPSEGMGRATAMWIAIGQSNLGCGGKGGASFANQVPSDLPAGGNPGQKFLSVRYQVRSWLRSGGGRRQRGKQCWTLAFTEGARAVGLGDPRGQVLRMTPVGSQTHGAGGVDPWRGFPGTPQAQAKTRGAEPPGPAYLSRGYGRDLARKVQTACGRAEPVGGLVAPCRLQGPPKSPGLHGSRCRADGPGSRRRSKKSKERRHDDRHFDHTRGYPGEGPQETGEATFCSINVTAWNSFAYTALFKDKRVDVFLAQEHKLQGAKAMQKARKASNGVGLNTRLTEALKTQKGGASGGVGVLWKQVHDIAVQDAPQGGIAVKEGARVAATRLRIGGVTFVCVSIYGDVSNKKQVQAMFEEVAAGTSYYKEPVVIAGDWNAEPDDVESWIGPAGDLQVVAPTGPTCWGSAGAARCIDFFVVNTTARRLMTKVWTEDSELCTHCPVFCSFQVEGSCCINTWIRPNSRIVPAKGAAVLGPQLDAGYEGIGEDLKKLNKVAAYEEEEALQARVDRIWEAWCLKAKSELDAAVGEEGNAPGQAYEYQVIDHLGAKSPARKSEDVQNAETIAWCRRRLIEAAGMAKKKAWENWSAKVGVQAKAKAKKYGRQCISEEAEQALQAPWEWPAETLTSLAEVTGKVGEEFRRQLRTTRLKEWKEKMADSIAAGTKEAFAFIKADDVVCHEVRSKGIRQVIEDNTRVWGPLWEHHDAGEVCKEARRFAKGSQLAGWCGWQPEHVREAAKSFRAGTSCTDGVPVRMYGMLSDGALEAFARQVDFWVSSAVWPSVESKVHTVLLPKPTGGERPIALFRTAVRLACKLISSSTATWMAKQEMPACNTAKGRRAGDGVWRTQMRSYITCDKEHGEVLIDMAKAFEYVDRKVLQQKAQEEEYPKEALAAALARVAKSGFRATSAQEGHRSRLCFCHGRIMAHVSRHGTRHSQQMAGGQLPGACRRRLVRHECL